MLQVGDTVLLRSGGQPMVVVDIRADGSVECVWQGGSQTFPAVALVKGPQQVPPLKTERTYDWDELTTEKRTR